MNQLRRTLLDSGQLNVMLKCSLSFDIENTKLPLLLKKLRESRATELVKLLAEVGTGILLHHFHPFLSFAELPQLRVANGFSCATIGSIDIVNLLFEGVEIMCFVIYTTRNHAIDPTVCKHPQFVHLTVQTDHKEVMLLHEGMKQHWFRHE